MTGSSLLISGAEEGVRRKIIALLVGVAVFVVVTAGSLATTANQAQAHAPCSGGSHSHYHFPFAHSDYWHDHGWQYSGGTWFRVYHIHNHNGYRYTSC